MMLRPLVLRLALLAALLVPAADALAVQANEILDDPALEARARDLSAGFRCLVCQNQSIDDSDSDFSHDLRLLVRERLTAGDTDEEVVAYVVDRYGDFVLLKPPFRWSTALLWGMPAVVLLIGGVAAAWQFRRKAAPAASEPLSAEEEAEVRRLMSTDEPAGGA